MLNIRSFIATQNLCCVKLLLWRLAEFSPSILDELNDAFAAYIKRGVIEIRLFDMATICRGKRTFLAKKPFCKGKKHELKSLIRYKIVGLSDFVRFVVLDLYEGIYVDGDTVFLKDMQLSWHRNFAYRWEHVQSYNTGIRTMNFEQKKGTSLRIMSNIFRQNLPDDKKEQILIETRVRTFAWGENNRWGGE